MMNEIIENVDSMSDQSFNLLIFLFASIVFSIHILNEAIQTKKIVEKILEKKIKSKLRYENFLENYQNTKDIYNYFLETKKRLPDNLHNIMLANCLNKDQYAEAYIRSLN